MPCAALVERCWLKEQREVACANVIVLCKRQQRGSVRDIFYTKVCMQVQVQVCVLRVSVGRYEALKCTWMWQQ